MLCNRCRSEVQASGFSFRWEKIAAEVIPSPYTLFDSFGQIAFPQASSKNLFTTNTLAFIVNAERLRDDSKRTPQMVPFELTYSESQDESGKYDERIRSKILFAVNHLREIEK